MNKMDREVKPPLELMEEVEGVLNMDIVPFRLAGGHGPAVWRRIRFAARGDDGIPRRRRSCARRRRTLQGLENAEARQRFGTEFETAESEISLIRDATLPFDQDAFWPPNNRCFWLGDQQLWRARNSGCVGGPGPAAAAARDVDARSRANEEKFAGVVSRFKPTWIRRTATASPSCVWFPATSSAA